MTTQHDLELRRAVIAPLAFRAPEYSIKAKLNSSAAVWEEFKDYANAGQEHFVALFLDSKNLAIEAIAWQGTIDTGPVYVREVLRAALILGAPSIVVFHNHPSGDPEPSLCDREITKALLFACKTLEIKFLDHIIIGRQGYYSFADKGLIQDFDLTFLSLAR